MEPQYDFLTRKPSIDIDTLSLRLEAGTGGKRCTRKVFRNKFERNAPEIRNWWYELFAILEADASIEPDQRREVLDAVFPHRLLNRILQILSVQDLRFKEELYEDRKESAAVLYQSGSAAQHMRVAEKHFRSSLPSTQRSTFDLDELQEIKKDLVKDQSIATLEHIFAPDVEPNKSKVYMDFFKRQPTRAAVWRTLPPLSMEEMNLSQKAEAVTEKIASEFVDWLKSLGGDEDTSLSVRTVVEMFEIGFHADTAKALKVGMKDMPSIPQKVAEARNLPHMPKRAVLQTEIQKDARATKKKPHLVAFGRSLPVELQIKPPDESNVKKWLVCEKVPESLESMATVWQGITHLKSTIAFCEFLLERPDVKPPRYLSELGMLDEKTLLDRRRRSTAYGVSTTQMKTPSFSSFSKNDSNNKELDKYVMLFYF